MHEQTRYYHLGCGERLQTGFSNNTELHFDQKSLVNRFVAKSEGKHKKTERTK